ncbi:MAG: CPBP family intramembrane metalloprotease [Defluviitaleaceae bacterium]|nr:CPBP family intramembrane metalloprotease [Defluviitaleaceae bacterium]
MLLRFFIIGETNREFLSILPFVFVRNLSSGMFEEIVFRGLLMTAMLCYWGNTVKGRLGVLFLNAAIFGMAHIPNGVLTVIFTFFLGFGFASVYIYSNNLLVIGIIHGIWNTANLIAFGSIANSEIMYDAIFIVTLVLMVLSVTTLAIITTIKAQPFSQRMNIS